MIHIGNHVGIILHWVNIVLEYIYMHRSQCFSREMEPLLEQLQFLEQNAFLLEIPSSWSLIIIKHGKAQDDLIGLREEKIYHLFHRKAGSTIKTIIAMSTANFSSSNSGIYPMKSHNLILLGPPL